MILLLKRMETKKKLLFLLKLTGRVTVSGECGKEGEPASNINYKANVQSDAPQYEISALINHVDKIAEIHNTLRKGVTVSLQPDV